MYDVIKLCRENGKNTSLFPFIDKHTAPFHASQILSHTNISITSSVHYFIETNASLLTTMNLHGLVLKGTHLSGYIASISKNRIRKCLKQTCTGDTPYEMCLNILNASQSYYVERQMYGKVTPGCILEARLKRYLEYKWICFRGYCPFAMVVKHGRRAYFTSDLKMIHMFSDRTIQVEVNRRIWDMMKREAQRLSKPFSYVRIDFSQHSSNGSKIHFDEFTFTPAACTALAHQQHQIVQRFYL